MWEHCNVLNLNCNGFNVYAVCKSALSHSYVTLGKILVYSGIIDEYFHGLLSCFPFVLKLLDCNVYHVCRCGV